MPTRCALEGVPASDHLHDPSEPLCTDTRQREALPLGEALPLAWPSPLSRCLALQPPPGGTARASPHGGLAAALDDATPWSGGPSRGTSRCVVQDPRHRPRVSSPPAAAAPHAKVDEPAGATILPTEDSGRSRSILRFFPPHAQHDLRGVGRTTPTERLPHPGRTGAPAPRSAVGIDTDVPVVVEGHNGVRHRVGPFHAR